MMVLNVVVSIVCITFCWCLVTLAVKGWARSQTQAKNTAYGAIATETSPIIV